MGVHLVRGVSAARAFPWAALGSVGLVLLSSTAHAVEAGKGMPQLDLANPLTISQVVWGAVIFFALYRLLSSWALPQVAEVLEMRAEKIATDLDAARAAKGAADAAIAELKASTSKAQAEAQAEVTNAVSVANANAAVQAATSTERLNSQLAAAEAQINAARAAAIGALREVATTTTTDVVTRLTGIVPDQQAIDQAVGNALAARRAA